MSRRQRHLNAAAAGATMVLDARYVDQTDNTAVGTWASRGQAGYNMTQISASFRPLLRTGANGINGANAVVFDGVSQYMIGVEDAMPTYTILSVAQKSGTAARMIFSRGTSGAASRDAALFYFSTSEARMQRSDGVINGAAISTEAPDGVHILDGRFSGSSTTIKVDGKTTFSETAAGGSVAVAPWTVGALRDGAIYRLYHNAKIGAIMVWNGVQLTSPMTRRLVTGMAYAFKIPCA